MKIVYISLRDNKTNISKIITQEYDDDMSNEGIEFMWTEGNYSCDCNRYNFFYPNSNIDYPCGESRFDMASVPQITEG